ncbi:uncharacterized protein LACBIDRAFT_329456 [Laccaria bicolor S238N-H82]|uniref:Predicted protein n=1 Tax=Laccaria bicolor (strain S238N-H82 / ATCC MYA-4686) TaxID=486041 RepID=B0DI31_LACBS|nr:uncharacterized protein LACBIDRAFT_329456 [Laccaria bicolor S238N-H82]EDR05837.1 predicted protein [Laccaria bicolor S238N-H82]|eukprot:XP_001883513.1 predicted protein [Laccaria bicolor S238N-H82]
MLKRPLPTNTSDARCSCARNCPRQVLESQSTLETLLARNFAAIEGDYITWLIDDPSSPTILYEDEPTVVPTHQSTPETSLVRVLAAFEGGYITQLIDDSSFSTTLYEVEPINPIPSIARTITASESNDSAMMDDASSLPLSMLACTSVAFKDNTLAMTDVDPTPSLPTLAHTSAASKSNHPNPMDDLFMPLTSNISEGNEVAMRNNDSVPPMLTTAFLSTAVSPEEFPSCHRPNHQSPPFKPGVCEQTTSLSYSTKWTTYASNDNCHKIEFHNTNCSTSHEIVALIRSRERGKGVSMAEGPARIPAAFESNGATAMDNDSTLSIPMLESPFCQYPTIDPARQSAFQTLLAQNITAFKGGFFTRMTNDSPFSTTPYKDEPIIDLASQSAMETFNTFQWNNILPSSVALAMSASPNDSILSPLPNYMGYACCVCMSDSYLQDHRSKNSFERTSPAILLSSEELTPCQHPNHQLPLLKPGGCWQTCPLLLRTGLMACPATDDINILKLCHINSANYKYMNLARFEEHGLKATFPLNGDSSLTPKSMFTSRHTVGHSSLNGTPSEPVSLQRANYLFTPGISIRNPLMSKTARKNRERGLSITRESTLRASPSTNDRPLPAIGPVPNKGTTKALAAHKSTNPLRNDFSDSNCLDSHDLVTLTNLRSKREGVIMEEKYILDTVFLMGDSLLPLSDSICLESRSLIRSEPGSRTSNSATKQSMKQISLPGKSATKILAALRSADDFEMVIFSKMTQKSSFPNATLLIDYCTAVTADGTQASPSSRVEEKDELETMSEDHKGLVPLSKPALSSPLIPGDTKLEGMQGIQ